MPDTLDKFVTKLRSSLADKTFVKLTLGNYRGDDSTLQKILARRIDTKKGERLSLTYRHETRDVEKNFAVEEGVVEIAKMLAADFRSAHLFATTGDLALDISKKGKGRLNASKPAFPDPPSTGHDREKKQQIDPSSTYLDQLGITTPDGVVRARQQGKWRQINKFVEILASLVDKSDLKDKKYLKIVDMGSGKGYLTFAAYDYFKNVRGIDVEMAGVEARRELVELCNTVAKTSKFDGLNFVSGTIDSFEIEDVDILIALHACDTATDDAIYKGIVANADLIVAAPCCHHEVRPQIKPPEMFRGVLKHGVMLERMAETLTDGLRSLLLEWSGYKTKMIEFVPVEHTPKNNMLVGTRNDRLTDPLRFNIEINDIKAAFGIRKQHLDTLLTGRVPR